MHHLITLSAALLACAATCLAFSSAASARENPLESLFRDQIDPKARAREMSALEAAVAREPGSTEAWTALLEWSFANEEPEETIARARGGLDKASEPAALWRMIAQVHLSDARSGPVILSRPGVSKSRTKPVEIPEEEFVRDRLTQALDALAHVLALEPGDRAAKQQKGYALIQLERWTDADTHWREVLEVEWSAEAAAAHAFCRAQAGQPQEARAEVEESLKRAPRSADLHGCHARILMLCGVPPEISDEAMTRANFYDRLMPDTTLDYTPEMAASLRRLLATKDGKPAFFSGDRDNTTIQSEIEALEERGDEQAIELLATLAWSHTAHGPMENQVYAYLAEHNQVVVLQRILAHSRSPCTTGGALRALVELKVDGVFEVLARLLPEDGGMFPMGILWQLKRLGDPRTGPLLIEYTRDRKAAFFEDALVVLGRFPDDAVRRHLEGWMADREAAPFAAAGLYQLHPDKRWWRPMEKALNAGSVWEVSSIADVVRELDTPEARKLIQRYDARVKREREKSR